MVRVTGIFTGITISPSLSPRQCPYRYAIRAGRNLPDEEFRYLRTVIVYGRRLPGLQFGASACASLLTLTFWHRAGVSPYTSSCDLAETCVFSKQSHGPFHCGFFGIRVRNAATTQSTPSPEVTGSFLPSSLARVLSGALGFSPRLPVSVCGTVTVVRPLEVLFLASNRNSLYPCGILFHLSECIAPDFPGALCRA